MKKITISNAFIFGTKIESFFQQRQPKDPETIKRVGTYGVNAVLLEYLGNDGYKDFCKQFKEKHSDKPPEAHFQEAFANNPQPEESIFYDVEIHFYYNGIMSLITTIEKMLLNPYKVTEYELGDEAVRT